MSAGRKRYIPLVETAGGWPMMRISLAFLLLAGCRPGFELDPEPSCNAPMFDWTGGLTFQVLRGPGDGTFDYDPRGDDVTERRGAYDFDTGAFSWEDRFAAESYRSFSVADGFGTVEASGDLDLTYTTSSVDRRGVEELWHLQEERVGCVEKGTAADGEGQILRWELLYGARSLSRFETREYAHGGSVVRAVTEHADLSYEGEGRHAERGYLETWAETGDLGTGYSRQDFANQWDDGTRGAGVTERFGDGSRHVHQWYTDPLQVSWTWDFTVSYDGDGSGSVEIDGAPCAVSYWDWQCTLRCGEGDRPSAC
jgi:hypothetical protein